MQSGDSFSVIYVVMFVVKKWVTGTASIAFGYPPNASLGEPNPLENRIWRDADESSNLRKIQ